MNNESSYRHIFKATSLFGGVQVLTIIFSIVKNKAIAMIMGANGIGFIGIFATTISLINSITSFGFASSSVKSISEFKVQNRQYELERTVSVILKLSLFVGVFGLLITLALSSLLGKVSFNSDKLTYKYYFMGLAVAILFLSLESGTTAILQGFRELRKIATSNIISSFLSLSFSIPLYYYLGIDGLVPSIICTYITSYFTSSFYLRKVIPHRVSIKILEELPLIKDILRLGVAMSISSILVYSVMFVIRIFISEHGSLLDVGYYQAAFSILNGYVGMIFAAMAKDYYPRLAEVNLQDKLCQKISNQQIEIGLLIIAPIISVLIVFLSFFIKILYTNDFIVIKNILYWSLLGMPFKVVSWSLSYIVLAKGDVKSFLTYEILSNIFVLVSHIMLYQLYGLTGLGYAFLCSSVFYFIIVKITLKSKYSILLEGEVLFFLTLIILCFSCLIIANIYFISTLLYIINTCLILLTLAYSISQLSSKLNFNIADLFKK